MNAGWHPRHTRPTPDDLLLFRWVHNAHLVLDADTGDLIVSSQAFKNTTGTDDMSVVLSDTWADCGRAPADILQPVKRVRVMQLTVGQAGALGQATVRAPDNPADECDAHGHVVGDKSDREVRQALRDHAVEVARL